MSVCIKLTAFLVANQLDIKGIKTFKEYKPLADSSSELFYGTGGGRYEDYFNYGVVVLAGFDDAEMKSVIQVSSVFQKNPINPYLRDEFQIRVEPGRESFFEYNEAVIGKVDEKVIRIAMLNLAQSVALDYYNAVAENLLAQVKLFSNELEQTGRLKTNRRNMLKFLGKALNTQNEIVENIYIFDAPDIVWDNEYLDRLNQGMIKHFDLRVRFSEIEYTLRIIGNNLTVFREIIHQRESSFLEYIVIILILMEVFDLLITRLLNFV